MSRHAISCHASRRYTYLLHLHLRVQIQVHHLGHFAEVRSGHVRSCRPEIDPCFETFLDRKTPLQKTGRNCHSQRMPSSFPGPFAARFIGNVGRTALGCWPSIPSSADMPTAAVSRACFGRTSDSTDRLPVTLGGRGGGDVPSATMGPIVSNPPMLMQTLGGASHARHLCCKKQSNAEPGHKVNHLRNPT